MQKMERENREPLEEHRKKRDIDAMRAEERGSRGSQKGGKKTFGRTKKLKEKGVSAQKKIGSPA